MIEELRRSAAHVFVDNLDVPQLSDDDFHHLGRVMRLRRGEDVSCSDGAGHWRMTKWDDGLCELGEVHHVAPRHKRVTLGVVPVKGDRTDLVMEKLVEIGVDRIVVLHPTDHSVVRPSPDKVGNMMDRFRRIGRAAAMQSRQVFLPEVVGPLHLTEVLSNTDEFGVIGVAEPGGNSDVATVDTLLIGPEGGFSPSEIAAASHLVTLGDSVLRAETAAIVGATLMVAHRGL
ncbi:MAG: hypothetical protein RIR69_809 [Actinomycetota bacterium]